MGRFFEKGLNIKRRKANVGELAMTKAQGGLL